jgi:hypothetical protein
LSQACDVAPPAFGTETFSSLNDLLPGLRKMRGIHELTLAERRVPYGRDHERHLPFRGRAFHFGWNALKGARNLGNAQPMRGLGLKLDGWDRPSSLMTFDGNPEPVQFIQPNVHHRAGFSVGKHDGFADQFGLRRTVLIQDFWRSALHWWHRAPMGRLCCPRHLNSEVCPSEWLMATALPVRGAGWFAF